MSHRKVLGRRCRWLANWKGAGRGRCSSSPIYKARCDFGDLLDVKAGDDERAITRSDSPDGVDTSYLAT